MSTGDLTLMSANCHIIEARDTFEGRMPAKWAARAPHIEVIDEAGGLGWIFEDEVVVLHRSCATVGMTHEQWLLTSPPTSSPSQVGPLQRTNAIDYSDIRAGCYQPEARLADMDLDGCRATALYSSPAGIGFGGGLFASAKDPELGIASMRAYNDWMYETWMSAAPDRFIGVQATWYRDPKVAAAEVYRNAERGFRGVMLRNPTDIMIREPWIGDPSWVPFLRACQETGTGIAHHTDPSRGYVSGPPYGVGSSNFQAGAIEAVDSFLWAGLGTRFPGLKVAVAESGGGWLPFLISRIEWCLGFSPLHSRDWPDPDKTPVELLADTFWFSTLEADLAYKLSQELNFHNWMIEIDYPHMESTWPSSQKHFGAQLESAGAPADFVEAITWKNVSELYNFPLPAAPAAKA